MNGKVKPHAHTHILQCELACCMTAIGSHVLVQFGCFGCHRRHIYASAPPPILGCRAMNVDHPRQPSASIALTVLEEKKKTKTVRIVADVIDVKYIEAVSDLDGDRLCIDTEVASDTESDDNSSHIGDGDLLVMPDLGDELVLPPHMSDSDNEESKDMGD